MAKKLILIGGMPGSGKTYIGKELARRIGLFVDKDIVTRVLTEEMLRSLGSHRDDRESDIYLAHVRSAEYDTMIKHALENVAIGYSVICSAPFISEFKDESWIKKTSFDAERLDAEIITIWIHVDFPTARQRIIARGASRDTWKLANWETYISTLPDKAKLNSDAIVIDNSRFPATPLHEQIEVIGAQLLREF